MRLTRPLIPTSPLAVPRTLSLRILLALPTRQTQLSTDANKMDIILLAPGAHPGAITLNTKATYRARTTSNPNTFNLEQKRATIGSSTAY